jgi:DnaK suppressor protein
MIKLQDTLKERLERERERLTRELQQLEVSGRESLGGNLEQLLKQVERALYRFDNGLYGICESCGDAIDPARLKALPHAARCFDCQQRFEH